MWWFNFMTIVNRSSLTPRDIVSVEAADNTPTPISWMIVMMIIMMMRMMTQVMMVFLKSANKPSCLIPQKHRPTPVDWLHELTNICSFPD